MEKAPRGSLGRPSAQKQYFPKGMFVPKVSMGRSCVKLNYSSFAGEHTHFLAQLILMTLLHYFLSST